MRGVIIYLKDAKSNELISLIEVASSKRNGNGEVWTVDSDDEDPILYIEFYEKQYWSEVEPEVWDKIKLKLGEEPKDSIAIDISGRHPGGDEMKRFLNIILSKYDGIVMDDYTEYPWNLDEIESNHLVEGHPFFDYQGWYGECKSIES